MKISMTGLFSFNTKVNLAGFTLIFPSISVGNIPQLTIDLLIASYNFKKVATIWHPAIIPMVGGDPYESNPQDICIACELYVNEPLKLAIIQLRSTIDFKVAHRFFEDFNNEVKQFAFKNAIILVSSFDYELNVVSGDKFYYVSNDEIGDAMKKLGVKPLSVGLNGKYVIHGSGFAVKLFESLSSIMKCTVLCKFVSEGDNRPDAIRTLEVLCNFLDNFLNIDSSEIKFPSSWKFVFGGPPPEGLF